jgi:hypothetical protein
MAGKLAKSEDAVVRLSSVAGALNWDMGVLAQTINNQSVLRLDNLGVAAEDVIPRFEELKAAGMGVKEAFTEALVEAGEDKWALIGDAAETTAGQLQQLTVIAQDARDAFSAGFAAGAAEELALVASSAQDASVQMEAAGKKFGDIFGGILTEVVGAATGMDELNRLLKIGAIDIYEFNRVTTLWTAGLMDGGEILEYVALQQKNFEDLLARGSEEAVEFGESLEGSDRVLMMYADSANQAADASGGLAERIEAARDSFQELNDEVGTFMAKELTLGLDQGVKNPSLPENVRNQEQIEAEQEALREIERAYRDAAAAAGDYFTQALGNQQDPNYEFSLADELYDQADAAGASAQALAALGTATGKFTEEEAALALEAAARSQYIERFGEIIASTFDPAQAAEVAGRAQEFFDTVFKAIDFSGAFEGAGTDDPLDPTKFWNNQEKQNIQKEIEEFLKPPSGQAYELPIMPVFEGEGFDFAGAVGSTVGESGGVSIPVGPDTSTFLDELESWENSTLTPFIEQPREIIISGNSDDAVSALQDVIDRMADIQDKTVTLTIEVEKNEGGSEDPGDGTE